MKVVKKCSVEGSHHQIDLGHPSVSEPLLVCELVSAQTTLPIVSLAFFDQEKNCQPSDLLLTFSFFLLSWC